MKRLSPTEAIPQTGTIAPSTSQQAAWGARLAWALLLAASVSIATLSLWQIHQATLTTAQSGGALRAPALLSSPATFSDAAPALEEPAESLPENPSRELLGLQKRAKPMPVETCADAHGKARRSRSAPPGGH